MTITEQVFRHIVWPLTSNIPDRSLSFEIPDSGSTGTSVAGLVLDMTKFIGRRQPDRGVEIVFVDGGFAQV